MTTSYRYVLDNTTITITCPANIEKKEKETLKM